MTLQTPYEKYQLLKERLKRVEERLEAEKKRDPNSPKIAQLESKRDQIETLLFMAEINTFPPWTDEDFDVKQEINKSTTISIRIKAKEKQLWQNIANQVSGGNITKIIKKAMNDYISTLPNAEYVGCYGYQMNKRPNSKAHKIGVFCEPMWVWRKNE